ncbi:hypothetical protein Q3G72_022001 [Acer saccharum]|nr:hypothetical protein Q3G72_022001 [Acer saccharum]
MWTKIKCRKRSNCPLASKYFYVTGVNNNASTTFNPTSQQRSGRERNWVIQIQEYESGWLLSDLFLVSNQELKLKFTFKLQLLS